MHLSHSRRKSLHLNSTMGWELRKSLHSNSTSGWEFAEKSFAFDSWNRNIFGTRSLPKHDRNHVAASQEICWTIIPKKIIKIGDFWTRIAKNKQKFENKITKMRKCLAKFSRIFEWAASVPVCTLLALLLQASLLRSDSFFSGAVCFVRRTLARSAFHGFSIGFRRWKSVLTVLGKR